MSIVDMHGHPYTPPAPANDGMYDFLLERIAELEFAMEDQGWLRIGEENKFQFSRAALTAIINRSRTYYLNNPMVRRAANLSRFYVFGQGISVQAHHEEVDEVVQSFWHDPKNVAELTTLQALGQKDTQLMTDGNIFFVLFTNAITGRVRVRTIRVDEVEEIICDPEDERTPWFYKRKWSERRFNAVSGKHETSEKVAYYPDWKHDPAEKVFAIAGKPVMWNSPVYHVAVGHMPWMTFGLPEFYPVLDWAKAYRGSIQDDVTRSEALSTFVWRSDVKGGAQKVAAAKAKLGTAASAYSGTSETNPTPVKGATAINTLGSQLEPYNVAGATLRPDHNRALRQYVVTALDLPETFFGDADVGNHATAKTLDRPTELKYAERQALWRAILSRILEYAIRAAALAPRGMIFGREIVDPFDPDVRTLDLGTDSATGLAIDNRIDVDFPMIVERDMQLLINALVTMATLDGKSLAGTVDMATLRRMLLTAMREDDIDQLLAHIENVMPAESDEAGPGEEGLTVEVRRLREALSK